MGFTPLVATPNALSAEELDTSLAQLARERESVESYTQVRGRPLPDGCSFDLLGAPWYWFAPDVVLYQLAGKKAHAALTRVIPYHKLISLISLAAGKPVFVTEGLNLPGLHIFSNESDSEHTFEVSNWHQDLYSYGQYMTSWVLPLQVPETPCGVDYREVEAGEVRRFNYEVGTLYTWRGELMHTISGMTLAPGERRVTIQAHTVPCGNDLLLFW